MKSNLFKAVKLSGITSWWDSLTPKQKLIRRSIHEYYLCLAGSKPRPLTLEDEERKKEK